AEGKPESGRRRGTSWTSSRRCRPKRDSLGPSASLRFSASAPASGLSRGLEDLLRLGMLGIDLEHLASRFRRLLLVAESGPTFREREVRLLRVRVGKRHEIAILANQRAMLAERLRERREPDVELRVEGVDVDQLVENLERAPFRLLRVVALIVFE